MLVFHVYSHINPRVNGNDLADGLADEGRASSQLYTYLLRGSHPTEKRRIDVPDVAEVQVIVSSDEEPDAIYRRAKRDYQLSGASSDNPPNPDNPPSSPPDFACDTPEPPESQDFI